MERNTRYHLTLNQATPAHPNGKVMTMPETLGELIQRRMREVGIPSKAELARRVGVSSQYMGDIINDRGKTRRGYYVPGPELLAGLSNTLKVPETEILAAAKVISTPKHRKIDSFGDLLKILEDSGIEQFNFSIEPDALERMTRDDYEELIERIKADIEITIKRKRR